MKKWKKILISLITVFVLAILPAESAILPGTVCVTEAAPRISSSRLRQILTQKDASELPTTLWICLFHIGLIFSRAPASPCAPWAFQLQNKLFPKTDRAYPTTPLAITARGVVLSAALQPIPLILPDSFLIRASCLSAQQPARNSGLLPQHASASLPERSPSSVLFDSWKKQSRRQKEGERYRRLTTGSMASLQPRSRRRSVI